MTVDPQDDNALIIALAEGDVIIQMFPDVAPLHVAQITELANAGEYDNVAWHRVIDGFVAQTGDVQFGDLEDNYDPALVGRGDSALPDIPAEFSDIAFERAIVGMARAGDPLGEPEREEFLNSANSQFFIMLDDSFGLNGRFTAFGVVIAGMDLVDGIKLGTGPNGEVLDPDRMFDVNTDNLDIDDSVTAEEAQTIALLYEAGLGRQAAYTGLNFWIDGFEAGLTINQIAQSFLDSAEFEANVGDPDALSDEEFVLALFDNVIGRPPAEAGLDFWVGRLEDGATRAETLVGFATVPENAAQSPEVFTLAAIGDGDGPDRDPGDALRQDFEPEWDFG